ncbi:unnamed protein product [Sphenostylis stenocarpa]|uniref:BSD domain-containing protein n=1 Tax=Sphenostylis stenocarpa TaxID=92480 RepID=A0AA86RVE3_9FABA|nr:unnamed protein product [Sphenostylis stenocarpa]
MHLSGFLLTIRCRIAVKQIHQSSSPIVSVLRLPFFLFDLSLFTGRPMEDLWKRAKTFAEEAAKKSQSLTPSSSRIADLVSETAKKSKELAAEASKKADILKSAALRQADQIKSFSDTIVIPPQLAAIASAATTASPPDATPQDLEKFGVSDDLRSFVKGLTSTTFENFPISSDEPEGSDVATAGSNVRKDLNEFQEKHATLVLTTVKEISRLRYELCPRIMKERHFWRIYFTLVNTHVAPYEKQYMEEVQRRAAAVQNVDTKLEQTAVTGETGKAEATGKNVKSRSSNSSSNEQDLDTFLLGDLEDSDEAPDDGEGSFDDDFDKIGNSDVEEEKHVKKTASTV